MPLSQQENDRAMPALLVKQTVARAAGGDLEAFSLLYKIHGKDLYRFAFFMLGNREDAQDAVQDAVLQAYTHIGTLRDAAAFKSWLFKILSNGCKTRLAELSRTGGVLPLEDFCELLPDNRAAGFQTSLELRDALYSLAAEERSIVLLSVFGGYKGREIADMLRLPHATVRSKLRRSLAKLGQLL